MDEAEVSGNDVPGLEGQSRKKLKLVRPDRGWSGGRPYMELGGRASAPYIAELIFLRQNGVIEE